MGQHRLRDLILEKFTEKAIAKKVQLVNKYIAKHRKDDVWAISPDSTWETNYIFEPVVIKGKFVYFQYVDVHNKKEKIKERYNINDEMQEDELKYMLGWVVKAIKKGYRDEGETPPKF